MDFWPWEGKTLPILTTPVPSFLGQCLGHMVSVPETSVGLKGESHYRQGGPGPPPTFVLEM